MGPGWASRSTSRHSRGTASSSRVPFVAGGSDQPKHRAGLGAGRGAGALRRPPGRAGSRLPVHPAGPGPLAPAGDRGGRDRRRALRGLLRARRGSGRPAAGHRLVHVGDRGRQPPSRRLRGGRGRRSRDRAHRRPPARAARDRRRADDRSAEALRIRGAVVLRGGQPRGRRRRPAPLSLRGLPGIRGGARRAAPGPGPPQRRLARPAGPGAAPRRRNGHLGARPGGSRRAAADGRRLRGAAGRRGAGRRARRAGVGLAPGPGGRRPPAGRKARRAGGRFGRAGGLPDPRRADLAAAPRRPRTRARRLALRRDRPPAPTGARSPSS